MKWKKDKQENIEIDDKNNIENSEDAQNMADSEIKEPENDKNESEIVVLKKDEYAALLEKAKQLDELKDTLMRKMADFENARKRLDREKKEFAKFATESLVKAFLPVIDNFDRAFAHSDSGSIDDIVSGINMIKKQIFDILASNGLERIDAEGKAFDPHLHEAMGTVPTDEYPADTVIEELQPGYSFKGRLLRPAWVRVAVENIENKDEAGDE